MYDLLVDAARVAPVPGNTGGSYLTMKSNQGLVFGAVTILSGFAGVFCDQGVLVVCLHHVNEGRILPGYWQRVSDHVPDILY